MISLDATLVFQIIGFFALLVVLNKFLYRPVLDILKDREDKVTGALKKAADSEKEVVEGLAAYDRKIKEAAVKGNEERGRIRQEGVEREKAILEAARAEAAAEFSKLRSELEAGRKEALASISGESKAISRQIAEKVLDRQVVTALLLAFGTLLLPSLGLASEGGGHGGGSGFTWKIINFVILVIGVYLVWTKALKGLLESRSSEIRKAIDEAQAAKAAADKKAAEYREKLNLLDKRVSEIQNELRLEGEAEKERLIRDAGTAAVKLKEQARAAVEQEIKKARLEIRREVAEAAIKMAEEILKRELSPADQERLVKGYLEKVRIAG